MNEQHLAAFVGNNADYYIHYWQQLQKGKRLSFNGAAFFLGLFWFIYRRMYLLAVLLVLGLTAEGLVEELVIKQLYPTYDANSPGRAIVSGLLVATVLSACGNWLYLRYAERKIAKVLALGLSEEETLMALRKKGGTSLRFFIIVAAVVAVAVTLARFAPAGVGR